VLQLRLLRLNSRRRGVVHHSAGRLLSYLLSLGRCLVTHLGTLLISDAIDHNLLWRNDGCSGRFVRCGVGCDRG